MYIWLFFLINILISQYSVVEEKKEFSNSNLQAKSNINILRVELLEVAPSLSQIVPQSYGNKQHTSGTKKDTLISGKELSTQK